MLKIRLLAALSLIALAGFAEWLRQPNYHEGPNTYNYRDGEFFMPGRAFDTGLLDVLKWKFSSRPATWPKRIDVPPTAIPQTRIHGGELVVTWVGHATVLIQTQGLNLLTDPIWAERASLVSWAGPRRVAPPGIRFDDLPPIDAVLISHSHFDHLDLPSLARLQERHRPLFIAGLGTDAIIKAELPAARSRALDWWQSETLSDGVRVHAVPVQHWSRRRLFDKNKALWAGFVLETPAGNVYIAGDTGFGDGEFFREAQRRFTAFRLALLPIGAYEPRWFMAYQHVNPAEAVHAHRLLQTANSLAMHYGTFQLTDEAIDAPRLALAEALREQGVPEQQFLRLPIGGMASIPIPTQTSGTVQAASH